jgi:hypothetical protein
MFRAGVFSQPGVQRIKVRQRHACVGYCTKIRLSEKATI